MAKILDRGLVAQYRVSSLPIIENLDVLENNLSHLPLIHIGLTMDPLILEAAEPTLRRSVIPAVSLAAHRAHPTVFPKEILESPSGILAAHRSHPLNTDLASDRKKGCLIKPRERISMTAPKYGTFVFLRAPTPDENTTLKDLGAYGCTMEGPIPVTNLSNFLYFRNPQGGSVNGLLREISGHPPLYNQLVKLSPQRSIS